MEVAEEGGDMGEFGLIKNEAGSGVLNELKGLNGRGGETS